MISVTELKDGEWYDGFLWMDGNQKAVATCKWTDDGKHFIRDLESRKVGLCHVADHRAGRGWTFEPNVISTGEPAS